MNWTRLGTVVALVLAAGSGTASTANAADLKPPAATGALVHATANSTNWAGWAVTPSATSAQSFRSVRAIWSVKPVTCTAPNASASFWVGLDGVTSSTVEQAGTSASCSNGTPTYYMWYQVYPSGEVRGGPVSPGDAIAASVSYDAGTNQYTLLVQDTTKGTTLSATKACASACVRSSAEIIAEADSNYAGQLPLADYGYTSFSGISITDANGVAGTLRTSSPWTKTQIQQTDGFTVWSVTGGHSTDGRSFGVTWKHA